MTEQREWNTAEPPWLHKLHPDLVDLGGVEAEQRAARLLAELERAAAGRVPPALAGPGWREGHITEYHDEPLQLAPRTVGPHRCQIPELPRCEVCGKEFRTKLRLAVHAYDHTARAAPRPAPAPRAGTADKPKPGARKRRTKRRR